MSKKIEAADDPGRVDWIDEPTFLDSLKTTQSFLKSAGLDVPELDEIEAALESEPPGKKKNLRAIVAKMKREDRRPFEELQALRAKASTSDDLEIGAAALEAGISVDLLKILPHLDNEQLKAIAQAACDKKTSVGVQLAAWQEKQARRSLPERRQQMDFFIGDIVDVAFKDDVHSMAAPIFSLATNKDLEVWKWTSKDGSRSVEVTPSINGRATIKDKHLLLFAFSQIRAGMERGREDAQNNRKIRFSIADFCATLEQEAGGNQMKAIIDGVARLHGTQIKTNIKTGTSKYGRTDFFHLLDAASVSEDKRSVEFTLSEWLYEAVKDKKELLTIARDYFRLRKPLEMRLYELARKECGEQARIFRTWEVLHAASGSRASLKEFKRMVKEIAIANVTPEYHFVPEENGVWIENRKAKTQ